MGLGGTEIAVGIVSLLSGVLLEWMRARGARSVTSLQVEDSRERRIQEASDALLDDYRQRLADAQSELEREARLRREREQELHRLQRERKHFHPKGQRGAQRARNSG